MNAEDIADTIVEACSLATALMAKGDFKGARELFARVADIQDRLLYLRDRKEEAKE